MLGYDPAIYQDSHRGWEFEEFCTFDDRGGVNIGAKPLLDICLIWFGYIARLSLRGGEAGFTPSNDFYLPSRSLEGRGVSTL
jgi:hypothetical protein